MAPSLVRCRRSQPLAPPPAPEPRPVYFVTCLSDVSALWAFATTVASAPGPHGPGRGYIGPPGLRAAHPIVTYQPNDPWDSCAHTTDLRMMRAIDGLEGLKARHVLCRWREPPVLSGENNQRPGGPTHSIRVIISDVSALRALATMVASAPGPHGPGRGHIGALRA